MAAAWSIYYFGTRYDLGHKPPGEAQDCAQCMLDVGDRWTYLAGIVLIIATAMVLAALKLRLEERRSDAGTIDSIIGH